MFDETESRDRERKIQSEFYDRNGRECLALFEAWKMERGQLGTSGADTETEEALIKWIKGKVDTLVEQTFIRRSDETNVNEGTFLVGWEDKASDIMLRVVGQLRDGKFMDHRDLLGYAFKSKQYAWSEFGRGVTRLIREGGRLPLFTGMDDPGQG